LKAPFCKFDFIPVLEYDGGQPSKEKYDNIPVLVSASEVADISVSLLDGAATLGFSDVLCALAAGRFIYEVRGLPLTEADVEILGNVYRILIDIKAASVSFKTRKCKQLLSKQSIKIENIDTRVSDYLYEDKRIRLFKCENADVFSEEHLRLFFRREGVPLCSVCAAYSYENGKVKFKFSGEESNRSKAALAASLSIATELSCCGCCKRTAFISDEGEITVISEGGHLTICSYS